MRAVAAPVAWSKSSDVHAGRLRGSRRSAPARCPSATPDGRFGRLTRLAVGTLAAQLLVVGRDQRWEAEEADPHEHTAAHDDGDKDEQEVELENAFDDQQAEENQARPQQPLLQVA